MMLSRSMSSTLVVMRALMMVVALAVIPSCCAHHFYVGGGDGWVEHPRESYRSWAGRNRFQVQDRLIFRYKQGDDSVLVVSETAYDSCNASNPKASYTDGKSVFQFDCSGPFYFISGAAGHCAQGQKLVVVVIATRNHTTKPPLPCTTPSPAPSPHHVPPPASATPSSAPSIAMPPTQENAPETSPPEPTKMVSSSASDVLAVSTGYAYLGVVMVAAMAMGRTSL